MQRFSRFAQLFVKFERQGKIEDFHQNTKLLHVPLFL